MQLVAGVGMAKRFVLNNLDWAAADLQVLGWLCSKKESYETRLV